MYETDDKRITGMKVFLYFTNNANVMTQHLLPATLSAKQRNSRAKLLKREKKWRSFAF
mgnify:CR=1 FL=1